MPTIGFDIEMFVADLDAENDEQREESENYITPCCGKIGGNKQKHITIPKGRLGQKEPTWEIHEDNVCVEVNSPVFTSGDEASQWLSELKEYFPWDLYEFCKLWPLSYSSEHTFSKQQIEEGGPQAQDIGCDPDFSAYSEDPYAPRAMNFDSLGTTRLAGGHIHLGYETHESIPAYCVAQLMDLIVAESGCAVWNSKRISTYGPGIHRMKPYGMEYRTLNTAQLHNSWRIVPRAFELAKYLEDTPQSMADIYSQFNFDQVNKLLSSAHSRRVSEELKEEIHQRLDNIYGSR